MAGTSRVVIRSCVAPVDSRSPPRRSRYPAAIALGSSARGATSGVSSSRARRIASAAVWWAVVTSPLPASVGGRRPRADTARLAGVLGEVVQARDVPLALDPDRVVRWHSVD